MNTRTLGSTGPGVSALGLGCMGMSDLYGPADEAESIATIHAALDAGITLLDTGDYYGMGHNELLIREALRGRDRDQVVISVKFGALRDPDGNWLGVDGRPAAVKNFLAYTLRRLGTDYVDIYRPGRVDPAVPIEETVGAIAEMVKAGYVRHIGLSEAGADDDAPRARRASDRRPADRVLADLARHRERDPADLPRARRSASPPTACCRAACISGHWSKDRARRLAHAISASPAPRFSGANLERNLALVDALRAIAASKGATVAQVAIAWVLSRGADIVPLVGARRRDRLAEALGAPTRPDVEATSRESSAPCRPAPPPANATAPRLMAMLDSERARV